VDFKAKVGRENIFKPKVRNEIPHHENNNIVRIISFATLKNQLLGPRCSRTKKFISTAETLLIGRLTTGLI
jgi:hypothetical protein